MELFPLKVDDADVAALRLMWLSTLPHCIGSNIDLYLLHTTIDYFLSQVPKYY